MDTKLELSKSEVKYLKKFSNKYTKYLYLAFAVFIYSQAFYLLVIFMMQVLSQSAVSSMSDEETQIKILQIGFFGAGGILFHMCYKFSKVIQKITKIYNESLNTDFSQAREKSEVKDC